MNSKGRSRTGAVESAFCVFVALKIAYRAFMDARSKMNITKATRNWAEGKLGWRKWKCRRALGKRRNTRSRRNRPMDRSENQRNDQIEQSGKWKETEDGGKMKTRFCRKKFFPIDFFEIILP
jgi:hypothetical protein